MTNIKTIIFDLGGVIINLAFHKTTAAFSQLSGVPQEQIHNYYFTPSVMQDYEKGLISERELRKGINTLLGSKLTDEQIDAAWNSMLLDLPLERLELMSDLRSKFKVIVLSNTNALHVTAFNQTILAVSGKSSLNHFADEVYFSHEMKMRKPDLNIYHEVLKRSDTKAENALFLDDTKANLAAAEQVGIQTMHILHPDEIFKLKQYV